MRFSYTMDLKHLCHTMTTFSPLVPLVGICAQATTGVAAYADTPWSRDLDKHLHEPHMGYKDAHALDIVQLPWCLHFRP